MGNLLGGKNKSRVTELDRAVLGLKKQRDELKRAQKRIEVNFANRSKNWNKCFVAENFYKKTRISRDEIFLSRKNTRLVKNWELKSR